MNQALQTPFPGDVDAGSLPMLHRVQDDAPAANEDSCIEVPAGNDLEAWARHTFGANGFGDALIATDATPPVPKATELHRRARAARSRAIGNAIAACIASLARALRRARERYRAYLAERETSDALQSLDDRTLRDLGYDRSEIQRVARKHSDVL